MGYNGPPPGHPDYRPPLTGMQMVISYIILSAVVTPPVVIYSLALKWWLEGRIP